MSVLIAQYTIERDWLCLVQHQGAEDQQVG
jgi:hypothetical protein